MTLFTEVQKLVFFVLGCPDSLSSLTFKFTQSRISGVELRHGLKRRLKIVFSSALQLLVNAFVRKSDARHIPAILTIDFRLGIRK